MSQSGPDYVITLLHGTFAPNAAWTKPRSKLRGVIQHSLREVGKVKFRRFVWRGFLGTSLNNGHRYRLAAGIRLAAKLEELCDKYPSARHFIVAHNHGGNVALYALRKPGLAGLVCIGTPFIHCEPRHTEQTVCTYADLILATAALAVLLLFALFLTPAAYFLSRQTIFYEGHGYKVTPLWLFQIVVVILGLF